MLLSIYYSPGSVLGAGDTVVSNIEKVPAYGAYIERKIDHKQRNNKETMSDSDNYYEA